jgi:hypothetical protein
MNSSERGQNKGHPYHAQKFCKQLAELKHLQELAAKAAETNPQSAPGIRFPNLADHGKFDLEYFPSDVKPEPNLLSIHREKNNIVLTHTCFCVLHSRSLWRGWGGRVVFFLGRLLAKSLRRSLEGEDDSRIPASNERKNKSL